MSLHQIETVKMAPPKKGKRESSVLSKFVGKLSYKDVVNLGYDVLFNPSYTWIASILLLIAEVFINVLVIERVKYTEIDWEAYMSEVGGFLNGTYDYYKLEGATGPLVYPAGFVYIFSGLYFITSNGTNIKLAQYIFAVLYLVFLASVFYLNHKTKVLPPYALFFMCCASYRIHSIFILRLFNDPVAMFLFYLSVCCMLNNHWNAACLLYSIAVGVKMNVLLFSPGLLLILLLKFGLLEAFFKISICAAVQLLLGLPFLLTNPAAYVIRSFDLGRQFFFKWTVNWRFLPEAVFLNRYFHVSLLALHLATVMMFWFQKWPRPKAGWLSLFRRGFTRSDVGSAKIIEILFAANFIGMAFSRSLHYQFYVWYFHTLPFLLWRTRLSTPIRLLLLGLLEMCWNTYPSTVSSSLIMHSCHFVIVMSLFFMLHDEKLKLPDGKLKEP